MKDTLTLDWLQETIEKLTSFPLYVYVCLRMKTSLYCIRVNHFFYYFSVNSTPDDTMTKIPLLNTSFLQVKVDTNNRTDTEKPNNSPVVLVKPFYR